MTNLCAALRPGRAHEIEKIAIAAAFHDIGIWTARTFDYLLPSATLACAHLSQTDRQDWAPEISGMIYEHHKLTRYLTRNDWLVEPFRRADLIDVSLGALRFGLARGTLRTIFAEWPDRGFHWKLVQLAAARFARHPLSPLPMVRW